MSTTTKYGRIYNKMHGQWWLAPGQGMTSDAALAHLYSEHVATEFLKDIPGAEFVALDPRSKAALGTTQSDQKPTNPKDALGSTRLDLSLPSPFAAGEEALAYEEGLCKYGRNNYRIIGVRASIYLAAALRHLWKYTMGEDRDPKTGVHHLGSVRACVGIILDARGYEKLTDDRPPRAPGFSAWLDDMEARVKHLREMFKDKSPKHYTIQDGQ